MGVGKATGGFSSHAEHAPKVSSEALASAELFGSGGGSGPARSAPLLEGLLQGLLGLAVQRRLDDVAAVLAERGDHRIGVRFLDDQEQR